MACYYPLIEDLKDKLGPGPKLLREIELSRATVYNKTDYPDIPLSGRSGTRVRKAHRRHVANVWLQFEGIPNQLNLIDDLGDELSDEKYVEFLISQLEQLEQHVRHGEDSPHGGAIDYVKAAIHYRLNSKLDRGDSRIVRSSAIDALYASAIEKLKSAGDESYQVLIHRIVMNRFSIVFNFGEPQDPKIKAFVDDEDIVGACNSLITQTPWYWAFAWNGIQAAEVLQDKEAAIFFYEALRNSHKAFKNPSYRPRGTKGGLDVNPDFPWFQKNILPKFPTQKPKE